ncbi:hypothetical protein T484DRAFT_1620873, partial [Baffinella frigidus]
PRIPPPLSSLNPTPTLHPPPSTLHPPPSTLHPPPSTTPDPLGSRSIVFFFSPLDAGPR